MRAASLFRLSLPLVCLLLATPCEGLEFTNVTSSWSSSYQQPRSTWSSLRIATHFNTSFVPLTGLRELRFEIVPLVVRWFARVLRVPRLLTPLKVPLPYCAQAAVPAAHIETGVDADAVIYIVTYPFAYHENHDRKSYGTACLLNAVMPNRVLAGAVWLQMDWFEGHTWSQKVDLVAKHFAQALGFDSLLFHQFNKKRGLRYQETELVKALPMAGVLHYFLVLPTVVQKARDAFNCSTLPGVRLAGDDVNDGGFNYYEDLYDCYFVDFKLFLTEWSATMMLNDFMSNLVVSPQAEYSTVSMAVFQDSGWYEVQWSELSPPSFGYKRGCEFFNTTCVNSGIPNLWEFCAPGSESCSADLTVKGRCSTVNYACWIPESYRYFGLSLGGNSSMDYCPLVESGISCTEGDISLKDEVYSRDSRCFSGQYQPIGSTENIANTHCHRVTCKGGIAFVTVGTAKVECPAAGGLVQITGYVGEMFCPAAERLCKPLPCKTLCSGRGSCVSGKCVCDSGFYGESCSLVCHQSCLTCVGGAGVECASCRKSAVLSSGTCTCKAKFTMTAAGECVSTTACDLSCLACVEETDCRLCRDPTAVASSGTCMCPIRKTMGPEGLCVDCQPGCSKCSYPDLSTCQSVRVLSLSCDEGYVVIDEECVCPDGTFERDSKCLPCHANCLTCEGDGPSDCLSCRSAAKMKKIPGDCICTSEEAQSCTRCNPVCQDCVPNDLFLCSVCRGNAVVSAISKDCICKDGFFPSPDVWNCQVCHSTCLTCVGASPMQCSSCLPGYDVQLTSTLGACACSSSSYFNQALEECEKCPEFCLYCNSPVCSTCQFGFGLIEGECKLSEGFYYESSSSTTYQCPGHCSTCMRDDTSMICLNCKATFELSDDKKTCNCLPHKAVVSYEDSCQSCSDPHCDECNGQLQCVKCMPTYTLHVIHDDYWWGYSSICVCLSGEYEFKDSCGKCFGTGCVKCTGPLSGECTECRKYYFLDNGVCGPCNSTCKTCNGPEDSNCTSCFNGFYSDSGSCLPCNPSCATCSGPNDNQCISCNGQLLYHGQCISCHADCSSCNGPGPEACTGCSGNAQLIGSTCYCNFGVTEGNCVYSAEVNTCHSTCKTCSGPRDRDCTSCYEDVAFLEPRGGTCQCKVYSIGPPRCRPCSLDCETCDTDGGCLACFYWIRITAERPRQCLCMLYEENWYPNPDTFHCERCHKKCGKCDGPNENQCTACVVMAELQPDHTCKCRGKSLMTPEGRCFIGSFFCADEICSVCKNRAVRTFFGFNGWFGMEVGDCNCPSRTNMGAGLYPDVWAGLCHDCDTLCLNCGRDSHTCFQCKAHAYIVQLTAFGGPGECQCNPGYYLSTDYEECFLCPIGCLTCSSETSCLSCAFAYELIRSETQTLCYCSSDLCRCPPNTYELSPIGTCEQLCPTGYTAKEKSCVETADRKFEFQVNSYAKRIKSGQCEAVLGDAAIDKYTLDGKSPVPLYQNGILFPASRLTYVDVQCDGRAFVLAPIHYIEMWQKGGDLLGITKGTDKSKMSYAYGTMFIITSNRFLEESVFTFPIQVNSLSTWTLIRYEFSPVQRSSGSILQVWVNNKKVFEHIFFDFFYRDDAFDTSKSGLRFWSNFWSEAQLGDFTIANQPWVAVSPAPCGCAFCSPSGSCFSNCSVREFQRADHSCAPCRPECSAGCIRGNDCSVNFDPLCEEYVAFTECRECKHLAEMNGRQCQCVEFARIDESNNTCVCKTHYLENDGNCVFTPDPLCEQYIEEPNCNQCVAFAELVDDFCTCIPHSSFNASITACACDRHFLDTGHSCIFDPLCSSIAPDFSCVQCVSLATYDDEFCNCVENSSQSADGMTCLCDSKFKPVNENCVPKFDPLCTKYKGEECVECTEMALLAKGACNCAEGTYFDQPSSTCVCVGKTAAQKGNCVASEDPLCGVLDPDNSCASCKPRAEMNDACECIPQAFFVQYNSTCVCGAHYQANELRCLFVPDPLCKVYSPSQQCLKCKELSESKSDFCMCVEFAVHFPQNQTCACKPHYHQSGSSCVFDPDPLCLNFTGSCNKCQQNSVLRNEYCQCVAPLMYNPGSKSCDRCLSFLTSDEITAELSEDVSSLNVTFQYSVSKPASCASVFVPGTFAKMGSHPQCTWNTHSTVLTVTLGSGATLLEEDIELNSTAVYKQEGKCSFEPTHLTKHTVYKGKKNKLILSLQMPSAVPLSCSETSTLRLNGKGTIGGNGKLLLYKWTIAHSSQGTLFTEYSSYSQDNYLELPLSSLTAGTLAVTLTAKDRLAQEATANGQITLSEERYLPVEIERGATLSINSDTTGMIRSYVTTTCGQVGLRNFTWSFEGASPALAPTDKDPAKVLSVSKVPYILTIEKRALSPGHSYLFKVAVQQGVLAGSAAINIIVVASDLVVRFSRVGGDHPSDVILSLSAGLSRDPDEQPGAMQFEWSCLEGDLECKDDSSAPLLTITTQDRFNLPSKSLRLGARYRFTVKIKKDTRSASDSIEFTIVKPTGVNLLLTPIFRNCRRHQYFLVVPQIDSTLQIFFKWKQAIEESAKIATPTSPADASYLAFSSNSLSPDTQYNFDLTASTTVGQMHMQVNFYVVNEPIPGELLVESYMDRPILPSYRLSANGWMDAHDNLPLSYQFCILIADGEICVSPVQFLPVRYSRLPKSCRVVKLKVQNTLGGLSQQEVSYTPTSSRQLSASDLRASFLEDIDDPENTLASIGIYSESIELDQPFFALMLDSLSSYMRTLYELTPETLDSFLGVTESLARQNVTKGDSKNSAALLDLLQGTLGSFQGEISQAQLARAFNLTTRFASLQEERGVFVQAILEKYYQGKLPSQEGLVLASADYQLFAVRNIGSALPANTYELGNATVAIPEGWLKNTELEATDVIDFHLKVYFENSTRVVDVAVYLSGAYHNYNIRLSGSLSRQALVNATSPFNITLPHNLSADDSNHTLVCVGLTNSLKWSPHLCQIVQRDNDTVTVSAQTPTAFTLLLKPVPIPPPSEAPGQLKPKLFYDVNPVPLALTAAMLVLGLASSVLLTVLKAKRKAASLDEKSDADVIFQPENIQPSVDKNPGRSCDFVPEAPSASLVSAIEGPSASVISEFSPDKLGHEEICTVARAPPVLTLWSGHLLVSAIVLREAWLAAVSTCLLTTEMLLLGMCYSFGDDREATEGSPEAVFRSFSGQDFGYIGITIAIGTVVSTVAQIAIWRLNCKQVAMAVCAVVSAAAFAGVVVLNMNVNYGQGGRWGESALFLVLLQLVVVEMLKSLAFWDFKRLSTASIQVPH